MTVRRATTAVVVAVVTLGLAGCGGKDDRPDTIEQPSPTATTTPAASPRDTAVKDAKAALVRFSQVTARLYASPKDPLDVLQSVAVGRGLGIIASAVKDYSKNGWHAVGTSTTRVIAVGKVSLDNSAPSKGRAPSVILVTCTDPTKSDVLDRTGRSIRTNPPRRFKSRFVMANFTFAADPHGGWRVSNMKDLPGSC